MLISPNQKLLDDVEAFLTETGIGPSYLGKRSVGNSELVERLRAGGRVWPETEDGLRTFMNKYREARAGKSAADTQSGEAA